VQQTVVNGLLEFQARLAKKKMPLVDAAKCSNMTLDGELTRASRDWSGSFL
jgi:hypothetical protein